MSGKAPYEYWDTCVFLAHLQKEQHNPGEAEEIDSQIRRFEMGALNLYTSAITITELIEAARLNEEQIKLLRGFFRRSYFQFIDANESVCTLASDIRSYYKRNPIKGLFPTTPDAIQVASAIAVRRQLNDDIKLITLDCNNKPNLKELAMIEMAPYIASQYGVIITRPEVPEILKVAAE